MNKPDKLTKAPIGRADSVADIQDNPADSVQLDPGTVDAFIHAITAMGKSAALVPIGAGLLHDLNNQATFIALAASQLSRAIGSSESFTKQKRNDLLALVAGIEEAVIRIKDKSAEYRHLFDMQRVPDRLGVVSRPAVTGGTTAIVGDGTAFLRTIAELTRTMYRRDVELHIQQGHRQTCYNKLRHLAPVLVNLLTNAFEAFGTSGSIAMQQRSEFGKPSLPVELARERAIWIDCQENGCEIILQVRDNGEGIEPDALSKVFDPLYTTRDQAHYAGLGLTMAKHIVEQLGGEISIQSELGKGTTVTVRIS